MEINSLRFADVVVTAPVGRFDQVLDVFPSASEALRTLSAPALAAYEAAAERRPV